MGPKKFLFQKNVVPSYGRFELAIDRGAGSYLWDVNGRRYLDMASGIAVCSLGHASADITAALTEQSQKLVHVSNLYYTEPQGRLAQELVQLAGPGKVFFSNSGAEANEGLYKLARKFGHDEGRKFMLDKIGADKVETTVVTNVAEGPDSERVFRELAQQGHKLI